MSDKKSAILRAAKGLTENYASEELFMPKSGRRLPNRSVIIDIVRDLKSIVFPGYFSTDTSATVFPEYYVGHRLNDLYDRLKNQIEIALLYHGEEPEEAAEQTDDAPAQELEEALDEPSALETALTFVDQDAAALVQAIGEPLETQYEASCSGPGDDGVWTYDGFTVYTYRENGVETIVDAE